MTTAAKSGGAYGGFRHTAKDLSWKPRKRGGSWFWNFGKYFNKKARRFEMVLLGPYPSYDEARSVGRASYTELFETYELHTVDRRAAASKIKAIRLEQGISEGSPDALGDALGKIRHKLD